MPGLTNLSDAEWLDLDRELCSRSLSEFIKKAWHIVEPTQPYIHGWHIDALTEHLEAVSNGDIKRLLINVPPGMMKSLTVGVFWPAWEWGAKGLPSTRYIAASHAQDRTIRDNLRMRRLVMSDWYQRLWPIPLAADQNAKIKFENDKTGFRQAIAMSSMTGERGDRVILDDPHSVESALSDAERANAIRVFTETIPTRVNSPENSAIVVIMQRIHQEDIAGFIIDNDLGYEKLILPMEYESDRKCSTSIGFSDPRTQDGELLFPERFPRDVVERDKVTMGSAAVAGQFQQRPTLRGGMLFKTEKFEIVDAAPADMIECRAWDLAGTKDSGDYTASCKMGKDDKGFFYIIDVTRRQSSPLEVEQSILNLASQDGKKLTTRLPQDPGQAGKAQVQGLIAKLAGYKVKAVPPTGSKVVRASPFAAQVEAGNVKLVKGNWNKMFIEECATFPLGKNDDMIDAASDAFNELASRQKLQMYFG